jgi:hypothetical protein
MGVLIALELGSGTGVRSSTDSAKELDCTSNVLASGSGVLLIWKPGFIAAGVVIFPFSSPLTCFVRFAVALFSIGVNSFFALILEEVVAVCRRMERLFHAERGLVGGKARHVANLCARGFEEMRHDMYVLC